MIKLTNNKKTILIVRIIVILIIIAVAIGSFFIFKTDLGKNVLPVVSLSVWGDERSKDIFLDAAENFKSAHSEEVNLQINISEENESYCKNTVLSNPEKAADVYVFIDDQFSELYKGGALKEITENKDTIISENGGETSGAIQASSIAGKLYAYPLASGNGYFLYYNSAYFNEKDVTDLDTILNIAEKNNKKFSMDFTSGWYIYSFFKGAGLDVSANADGLTNKCNWNSTVTRYKGVDVANAMLKIATHKGFINQTDEMLVEGIKDGSVIAAVNGAWNSKEIETAFGKNFAATKLPEYTINGDKVQMCSFSGYKLVGVNPHSKNIEWASKFAEYLTNRDVQMRRYKKIGECPSNINVIGSAKVELSPVVKALTEQSKYAYKQDIAKSYWNAACTFGISIAEGNTDKKDLQSLLDKLVTEIEVKQE